jgi:hypothetical protein
MKLDEALSLAVEVRMIRHHIAAILKEKVSEYCRRDVLTLTLVRTKISAEGRSLASTEVRAGIQQLFTPRTYLPRAREALVPVRTARARAQLASCSASYASRSKNWWAPLSPCFSHHIGKKTEGISTFSKRRQRITY